MDIVLSSNESTDKTVLPTLRENQYNTSAKFAARVMIHGKYGTNKTLWPIWLFNQYQFAEEERIIEFGCGTGLLWKVNSSRVNPSWKIELTDFSQGMIEAAKAYIGVSVPGIKYRVVDLAEYKVGEDRYTHVIANHMLYHVVDREKAIRTIYEILEPGGELLASTVGLDNMQEMKQLVSEFTGNDNYAYVQGNIAENFSLENGADQLAAVFDKVEWMNYEDSLEITDATDLANYVVSCNDMIPGVEVLPESGKADFERFAGERILRDGMIRVTKASGFFRAKKRG
jgi:ubiquinone/menaquinone biosynthesis C-methylase UbiE